MTGEIPDLAWAGAGALAAALAAGTLSAAELLDATLARIERLDGALNAIVVRDVARARAAAVAADAALARGERKPLLGVPMTVKESNDVAGLATTWGRPDARDWIAPKDSVGVARLKAAGAIVIGKTNVPLDLGGWYAGNEIYGRTVNPWNPDRTPGGSSGGAAAALAAGLVPLELGSDVAGSIRVPAAFCGVYGHKPSETLIPTRGHAPPGLDGASIPLSVIGPMARTASDLALALGMLAGPDADMAGALRLALPAPRHARLADYRVLVIDQHPSIATAEAQRQALGDFADRLAAAGARVDRASPLLPDLARDAEAFQTMLMALIIRGQPPAFYAHIDGMVRSLAADDRSLGAARLRGIVLPTRDYLTLLDVQEQSRRQFAALFRDFDVVVCPCFGTAALPHDDAQLSHERSLTIDGRETPYADQIAWPGVATFPGLPATAMPIGQGSDGLPLGVQVIGPFLEDLTPIEFARLAEREFGGFTSPPGFA